MKSIVAAIIEAISNIVTKLIREDKKASDADTPKDIKDRWDRHVRDQLRDD